ncbi:Glutathione S-transferase GST-4.5 [Commensalibacter sp. Nvir]|uniref:glutathione S-transferase family protein n=1 Tax=Commensalibacter sp. Nvir TaxID=3069817 RepID=UPI002D27317C|nr:Glutathione S-transferase GST-4.5 [Commensalibacter sp. Nvir]
MKLYSKPGSCSTADHIALVWCDAEFECEKVTPETLKDPKFLKLNPLGQVPVITDGSYVLTQNCAILMYIAERFPKAKLLGDGSLEQKCFALKWLTFINSDIHPAFGLVFGGKKISSDTHVLQALEKAGRERVLKFFTVADAQLNGNEWLTGFRSVADPYLFMTLTWAKALNIDFSHLKNLTFFYQKMEKDSGVMKAFRDEGLEHKKTH